MSHWALIADQMDYDDREVILGIFDTRDAACAALVNYLQAALARHPSNRSLSRNDYTASRWEGPSEVERWEKRGGREWGCTLSPSSSDLS